MKPCQHDSHTARGMAVRATAASGQAYDGAGAMAGLTKGVAARIRAKYPKATYTHCASHRLNLCIVKSCSIREISNMMQTADSISRFFLVLPKKATCSGEVDQ